MKNKFDFNDITLVPAALSAIKSRSECNIFYDTKKLPLICSPMDTVINDNNVKYFNDQKILTCSIRKQFLNLNQPQYSFISVSLQQFEYIIKFCDETYFKNCKGILIDIANAHMSYLLELVTMFKKAYPEMPLMVGNIANPDTFSHYCDVLTDIDYVRIGIGGGSACTSSANTGIHYPYASLIEECATIKVGLEHKGNGPNIVADGGFRNFDEINKALNLGADYVMLGSIFGKSLEACGDVYYKGFKVNKFKNWFFKKGYKLTRKYRGMSTKEVQVSLGKKELKTSEGISYKTTVDYTLKSWTENFKDYLKSCMSYSGTKTLKDFIGNKNYVFISENALKRFKK